MIKNYKIFNDSNIYSGNNTTLTRLANILNLNLTNKIENNIIGIHAFKFGKKVIGKKFNFILIIGGTDLNEDINIESKKEIIVKTLIESKKIICFNSYLKNKVEDLIGKKFNDKIHIIPQSIYPNIIIPFHFKLYLKNFTKNIKYQKIFIINGNLRKVKNPFYFEKTFNNVLDDYLLILIGENLDNFKINNTNNFIYIGPIDSKYIPSIYQSVDGLINCSHSEGMSIAILEAMYYKCPVYAINIEGNKSIIKDNFNGFLFNNHDEFIDKIKLDTTLIKSNAFEYIKKNHDYTLEKEKYFTIF